jgi:uncharacterized protein YuzE
MGDGGRVRRLPQYHLSDLRGNLGSLKIKYSNEADILLIEFKEGTPVDSIDLKEGIILHLDEKGVPIEMEVLDASTFVSMDEFNILIPRMKNKELAVHA